MDVNEVLKKYSRKIESDMNGYNSLGGNFSSDENPEISREFLQFKQDMMPEFSRFERWCNSVGKIIKMRLSAKDNEKIGRKLNIAHLNVHPWQVVSLALMSLFLCFFLGVLLSVAIFLIRGDFPILFLFLIIIFSFFVLYYIYSMPDRLANKWRLKASSQMVPAILYTVVYMKHTSNLERAMGFVGQHIGAPLSLDFRKILWDVQTGRFSNIKESIDNYLKQWEDYSIEFIESFHLIESSLYEPSEQRRVQILERALQVILDGVYDKMLKFTHDVKSPLTNLYMLGIILPTLGLALLPMASSLLQGKITGTHVFVLFNLIVPFLVFYMTSEILLKRPGGYGETELFENSPLYSKYKSKKPYLIAFLIALPIFILGISPLIFGYFNMDYKLADLHLGVFGTGNVFDFQENTLGAKVGPFGTVALFLSLLVPLSFALFFGIAYRMKTKEIIKARDSSKDLEKEFVNSLFTLGNRIGDGVPAEIAFAKVAESTKGQKTQEFFQIVNSNIQSMGMGLDEAIFNKRRGALIYFPSTLIATSMRILVESVKKGLSIASQSLMSISQYIKNIQRINERLKDLLADVISDMKSNMTFLAPLLAGIVVGLAAMITSILGILSNLITQGLGTMELGPFGQIGGIMRIFEISSMIPPYYLQIFIGIYIIQITFILSKTLVSVDAGEDKIKEMNETGKNLLIATGFYLVASFIAVLALSLLAGVVLRGLMTA